MSDDVPTPEEEIITKQLAEATELQEMMVSLQLNAGWIFLVDTLQEQISTLYPKASGPLEDLLKIGIQEFAKGQVKTLVDVISLPKTIEEAQKDTAEMLRKELKDGRADTDTDD